MNILFIGMYPNEYNKYRNVFFQNVVFAMADAGGNSTVISPLSVTKYRRTINMVSKERMDTTIRGEKYESFIRDLVPCQVKNPQLVASEEYKPE